MIPKTEKTINTTIEMACSRLRGTLPRIAEIVGEEFTGELTVRVLMSNGGVARLPEVHLVFR